MRPPVVILVGTSHPGNVGAAARGAANFGVEDLRFVEPRCDVHGPEALDRSVHARGLLKRAPVHADLEDALAGTALSVGTTARSTTADRRFLRKPEDVRDWAAAMATSGMEAPVALVFGPEDTGLRAEHVNRLDRLVTVPTATYASLNLAHAVSLLCYEHFRVREVASISPVRQVTPDTLRTLHHAWDALTDCTEPRAWRRTLAQGIFRKLMGRAMPDDHEIHNILGILTNALRRFDHPAYATAKSHRVLKERGMLAPRADEEE